MVAVATRNSKRKWVVRVFTRHCTRTGTIAASLPLAWAPACNALLGNDSHALDPNAGESVDGDADTGLDAMHGVDVQPDAASDGAALDDGPPAPEAGPDADGAPILDSGADAPCATIDDCPTGKNCAAGACVDAVAGCAAQKNAYPASQDGTYWVAPSGAPERAFCDMRQQVELCTEISGEHAGQTREGSNLAFEMSSQLLYSLGVCRIWAVRGMDGYPFTALDPGPAPPLGTCAALGFVADDVIGTCRYGTKAGYTTAGYSVSVTNDYGNLCTMCGGTGAGSFKEYVLQGAIASGHVMSSFDGTTSTTCRIR
jgi:hypothetical protein